jgi:hypothetical protein
MRKRLAQFGFAENQIQAIIHPEKAATMQQGMTPSNLLPAHQPTYPKTHKDHLSIDTLVYYDIPYEIDPQDSNYIIILREMDIKETDILFEHTRRLRQRNSERLLIEERASDKPDYAWVRRRKTPKKSESRYETFRYVGAPDSGLKPRRGRAASREARSWKKRTTETDVREASPRPVIKELIVNLQVPPFLAWPTTLEEDEKKTVSIIESHIPGPRTFLHDTTSMSLEQLPERHLNSYPKHVLLRNPILAM